jgi:ParB-like chromosome segregation protein Spo0J
MPDVALELIKPNPFRDFDLHPIDEAQVERLKASIDSDGFWSSVVARKVAGSYEIAFGHHRIEAARRLGWTHAPIEVRDLSDWDMVRMLTSENATQRGSTAAAALDAVAALARVLAYNLLRWDEARSGRNLPQWQGDYHRCRGNLEAGHGIGHDCIEACPPRGALTEYQIKAALGHLKDSGRMAAIVAEAQAKAGAELRAEQEAAELALVEAERKEVAARSRAEKQAAAKVTKKARQAVAKSQRSTAAGGAAVTATRHKQPTIYDARCAHLFKRDSHADTFRKIVTGETFLAYLKHDQQFDFAKSVLAALRENAPNKEITTADIRTECWSRIETGLGMPKGRLRTAPERPYLEEIKEGLNLLRRAEGDFKRGVALLIRGFQLGERLDAKQAERLSRTENTFVTGWNGLKEYRTPKQHLRVIGEDADE